MASLAAGLADMAPLVASDAAPIADDALSLGVVTTAGVLVVVVLVLLLSGALLQAASVVAAASAAARVTRR
jgi:hypothetical protein